MKNQSYDLKNWMSNLPSELRSRPLVNISIPGSHNSFSYSISGKSPVSPDLPKPLQVLSKLAKPIVNRIICAWSRTQSLNVTHQLEAGIRYFDIRLACNIYNDSDENVYVCHGLYGSEIMPLLQDIQNFLAHSRDIVILDFQHFYNFSNNTHIQFLSLLSSVFTEKICHNNSNLSSITLNTMNAVGAQVLIIYRWGNKPVNEIQVWPSKCWPTPWPNTLSLPDLFSDLDKGLRSRDNEKGFVSQCIVTVDSTYVIKNLFSNLKRLASRVNTEVMQWIKSQKSNLFGINVVIVDFIETINFCETVIQLNYNT